MEDDLPDADPQRVVKWDAEQTRHLYERLNSSKFIPSYDGDPAGKLIVQWRKSPPDPPLDDLAEFAAADAARAAGIYFDGRRPWSPPPIPFHSFSPMPTSSPTE